MAKVRITVWAYRCERCDHQWLPRGKLEPKICPKCKSPYWDRQRRAEQRPSEAGAAGEGE